MIKRGNYYYEILNGYSAITVKDENMDTVATIMSEDVAHDYWLIQNGADPINDGWEDGLGNILANIIRD